METKIKVCIAEDFHAIRESVILQLSKLDTVNFLFGVSDGEELIGRIKDSKPDVIILDINMPVMNGLEALKIIKTENPEIKVIMFSSHYKSEYIDELFARGASGFLPKDSSIEEMGKAIITVYNNGIYRGEDATEVWLKERVKEVVVNKSNGKLL